MSLRRFFSSLYPGNQGKGPGRRHISYNDIDTLPAFPKGMRNNSVDVLIKEHSDFIGQILIARGLIGDHNRGKAELLVHGPIRNYANIVHYLPATQDEYYSAEGGLFRFGLECAFHSYRSSCAKIMNSNLVETRIDSDMRWNHAAFLSGLYSEAIKTLSGINIYSIDGTPWHQGHEIFSEWMKGMKVASYQVSWRQEPNEELATTVAARIIGQGIFGFLAAGEKNIITTFCDSLMNPNNTQNPLTAIVRAVRHKLISRDIEQNAAKYGVKRYGMHLEPWLIDTFRYLYNTHKWTVNAGRSAIWYGRDGVYVTWPGSFGSLVDAFKETNVPFIPHGAAGLISVLHDSKIITGDGNELIYTIRIREETGKERMNTAIRLANPDIVFYGKEYPDPLDYTLEYGLQAGNSSMSAYVGEYGGERNDDAIKKDAGNNAAPNALTVDAVIPNSCNISVRPVPKNDSKNNKVDGSSRDSTAPKATDINLMEMFSMGDGAGQLQDVDGCDSIETTRHDLKTNSGTPDNQAAGSENFKAKSIAEIHASSPELSKLKDSELNGIADFMASLNNGHNIGDDALPAKKVEASDAGKNNGLSAALAVFEELDNHSFGKGEGGRSNAIAAKAAENADAGVSGMESPGDDGCAAVSGNEALPSGETVGPAIIVRISPLAQVDEAGSSLNINTPDKSDASEPPAPVSAIDVNGDRNRQKAVKLAGLECVRPNPRQAAKGVPEMDRPTLDLATLFEKKD